MYMSKLNKVLLSVVAALALAFGVVSFTSDTPLGAAPGPEHTEHQYFIGGLTQGSNCFATSTTGTLTASVLNTNSCIYVSPSGAGQATLSLTLPATTTMGVLLPRVGDCQSWWVDASDVAAGTTTTFVAGAGHDVVGLDATGAGTGADVIDGAEYGRLTMCRQTDGDVTSFVQEWINAD